MLGATPDVDVGDAALKRRLQERRRIVSVATLHVVSKEMVMYSMTLENVRDSLAY